MKRPTNPNKFIHTHISVDNEIEWDKTSKSIHLLLSIIMSFQMVIGVLIHEGGYLTLYIHEIGGLLALLILVVEWMWIFAKNQFSILFPWSGPGLRSVQHDIKQLTTGQLPRHGAVPGLPNFWHGIGLIIFSLMGLLGLLLLFNLPGHSIFGTTSNNYILTTRLTLLHVAISYLAWIYLGGHILSSLVHQLMGERLLGQMFLLREDGKIPKTISKSQLDSIAKKQPKLSKAYMRR